jgi:hypothetical protein
MSSLMPVAIPGHIVLNSKVDPFLRFTYVTHRFYGPPVKEQPRAPPPQQKPRDIGDERHKQLLGAIKGINVKQQSTQIVDALPGYRDWR